jgi:hypothetical protein
MERRRSASEPRRTGRVTPKSSPWPNLQELIDADGSITIGAIPPVQCAAVASDEYNMLAALRRRPRESLTELLDRLDAAVAAAEDGENYIDEING